MSDELIGMGDCGDVLASLEFEAWARLHVQAAADIVMNAIGLEPIDIPWSWNLPALA